MNRLLYAAPAIACAGLLAFGYYLQYFQYQDPCPLCLVQRGFFYGVLAVSVFRKAGWVEEVPGVGSVWRSKSASPP